MKAKIINTYAYNETNLVPGEIVEIVPGMETEARIGNASVGKLFLCRKQDGHFAYSLPQHLQLLPEESDSTDWSAFRREAAKDILCAFASKLNEFPDVYDPGYYSHVAVEWADELIKQLKEVRNEKDNVQ